MASRLPSMTGATTVMKCESGDSHFDPFQGLAGGVGLVRGYLQLTACNGHLATSCRPSKIVGDNLRLCPNLPAKNDLSIPAWDHCQNAAGSNAIAGFGRNHHGYARMNRALDARVVRLARQYP